MKKEERKKYGMPTFPKQLALRFFPLIWGRGWGKAILCGGKAIIWPTR